MFAWRRHLRRRVIVNLKSRDPATAQGFRAILWAQRGPLLILRDAELLAPRTEPVKIDGEVIVERVNIEFIQVLINVAEG